MAKYEFIDSQKNSPGNTNPVWKMCRWLAVSASGFYDLLSRPLSATAARRQVLTTRIRHYFDEYNSRRRLSALDYRRPNEVHYSYQQPPMAAQRKPKSAVRNHRSSSLG